MIIGILLLSSLSLMPAGTFLKRNTATIEAKAIGKGFKSKSSIGHTNIPESSSRGRGRYTFYYSISPKASCMEQGKGNNNQTTRVTFPLKS